MNPQQNPEFQFNTGLWYDSQATQHVTARPLEPLSEFNVDLNATISIKRGDSGSEIKSYCAFKDIKGKLYFAYSLPNMLVTMGGYGMTVMEALYETGINIEVGKDGVATNLFYRDPSGSDWVGRRGEYSCLPYACRRLGPFSLIIRLFPFALILFVSLSFSFDAVNR
ncbi:MAG TPA: hypothetical protein VLG36_05660 [Candidatus Chromulinivoraceae bacterium]|nr:hypothetical protein [Candidatus Chromulinivoraceae bacterium]